LPSLSSTCTKAKAPQGTKPKISKTVPKWVKKHADQWSEVPFPKQKRYFTKYYKNNPFFWLCPPRAREVLLLEQCRFHKKSRDRPIAFDIQQSSGRVPKSRTGSTTQMPMSVIWYESSAVMPTDADYTGGRWQFGIESLLLQGACLDHMRGLFPSKYTPHRVRRVPAMELERPGNAHRHENCKRFSLPAEAHRRW
jgi:hypothetical protein